MIAICVMTSPGGGVVLHIQGLGGWSAFELDRVQATTIRDALTSAIDEPEPQTLDELIRALS